MVCLLTAVQQAPLLVLPHAHRRTPSVSARGWAIGCGHDYFVAYSCKGRGVCGFDSLGASLGPTHPSQRYWLCRRCIFIVNLQRGQEFQGLHEVRSLFLGAILRLEWLNGLSASGG